MIISPAAIVSPAPWCRAADLQDLHARLKIQLHANGTVNAGHLPMALVTAAAMMIGTVVVPCCLAFLLGPFRER